MKFGQRTNLANILDEFVNYRDSLVRLKVMDLDNPNYIKVNIKKKACKPVNFRDTEHY